IIKPKLMALAEKLGVPYLRYERDPGEDPPGTVPCADMAEAAAKAVQLVGASSSPPAPRMCPSSSRPPAPSSANGSSA
ncbi:hypothetical protein, partial [Methylogaea oryzae]|uniref:hypothetical protein n=1 Tax=Methylogaea oryzae TaxID=1295382 RepID=UPI0006D138FE